MLYDNYENKIKKVAKVKDFIVFFRFVFLTLFVAITLFAVTFISSKGRLKKGIEMPSSINYGDDYEFNIATYFGGNLAYFEYREETSTEWSKDKPTKAGTYYVRAVTYKFVGLRKSSEFKFTINKIDLSIDITSDAIEYGTYPEYSIVGLASNDSLKQLTFTFDSFASSKTMTNINLESVIVNDKEGNDVTACYNLLSNGKEVEFNKRSIEVNPTMDSSYVYSGEEVTYQNTFTLSKELGYTDVALVEGKIYDTDGIETKAIKPGEYIVKINKYTIKNSKEETSSNYEVKTNEYTFNITKRDVIIESYSDSKVYDGISLTNGNFKISDSSAYSLVNNDRLVNSTTILPSITFYDENGVNNILDIRILDEENNDVTSSLYNVKYNYGTLFINKRSIEISTTSDSKVYDGIALSHSTLGDLNITKGNLTDGDELYLLDEFQPSITEPGKIFNEIKYSIKNSNGEVIESYEIIRKDGILEVFSKDIIIKPTDLEFVYGEDYTVDSNKKYSVLGHFDEDMLNDIINTTFIHVEYLDMDNNVVTPKNVGEYIIRISSIDKSDRYDIDYSSTSILTITPKPIKISLLPFESEYVYSGNRVEYQKGPSNFTLVDSTLEYDDYDSLEISVEYHKDSIDGTLIDAPKNVGTYYAKYLSVNSNNYTITNSIDLYETLKIVRANIFDVEVIGYNAIYDGKYHNIVVDNPKAKTVDGSPVTWQYSNNMIDWSYELETKNATTGTTYHFKASAENHNDYYGMFVVVIENASITNVEVTGYSGIYDGNPHNIVVGTPTAQTVDNSETTWLFSTNMIDWYNELTAKDVADSNNVYYYKVSAENHYDATDSFNIQIEKANITNASVVGYSGTYDGQYHDVAVSVTAKTVDDCYVLWEYLTEDGYWIDQISVKNVNQTGTYQFRASAINHNSITGTFNVTISPADLVISITGYTGIYDGIEHDIVANKSATTKGGETVTWKYSTDGNNWKDTILVKNVKDSNTFYYKASAENHNTIINTFVVTISKATYDMSGVSFEDKTITYDGTMHIIEITGTLPEGVTVSYLGSGTVVGSYQITALFDGDYDNYYVIPSITATLTITPAYITDVIVVGYDGIYDGDYHNIVVGIPKAKTVDNSEITWMYSYNGDNWLNAITIKNVLDSGTYWYKASAENHYDYIYEFEVTVYPAKITNISITGYIGLYDGSPHNIVGSTPKATTVDSSATTWQYSKISNQGPWFDSITATNVLDSGTYYYKVSAVNHNDKTGSFKVTIAPRQITDVNITGYSGTYDGVSHSVVVGEPTANTYDDSTITWLFGTDGKNWDFIENVKWKNATEGKTFYYKASAVNHEDKIGTFIVVIEKANLINVSISDFSTTYNGKNHSFLQELEKNATAIGSDSVQWLFSYDNITWENDITVKNVMNNVTYYFKTNSSNYNEETGDFKVTISPADLEVSVTGYSGVYDGQNHNAIISAIPYPKGGETVTWKYSTDGNNWQNSILVKNVADSGTYYYKASASNHNDSTGTFTVAISKANLENVSVTGYNGTYDGESHNIAATKTATPKGGETILWQFSEDGTNWFDEIKVKDEAFEKVYYYKASAENHNEKTGNFKVTVSPATFINLEVTPYSGTYDGNSHDILKYKNAETVDGSPVTWQYSSVSDEGPWVDSITVTNVLDSGIYYFKISAENVEDYTGSVQVTVKKASITNVSITGYNGIFDNATHNIVVGTPTAQTVDNSLITWQYSISKNGPWSSSMTLKNVTNNTYWYKASALNHEDKIGSFNVTISPAEITNIEITGYNGIYDGKSHNVVVGIPTAQTVGNLPITWLYSIDGINWESSIEIMDVIESGTYHYKANANNHNSVTGTFTVIINPLEVDLSIKSFTKTYDDKAYKFTVKDITYNSEATIFQDDIRKLQIIFEDEDGNEITELINANTYNLKITLFNIANAKSEDRTGNYEITISNKNLVTFIIEKRKLKVDTRGKIKLYDGEILTDDRYSIYNDYKLITGHTEELDTINQPYALNKGDYIPNKLTFIITDALGNDVTNNYEVIYGVCGHLIVTDNIDIHGNSISYNPNSTWWTTKEGVSRNIYSNTEGIKFNVRTYAFLDSDNNVIDSIIDMGEYKIVLIDYDILLNDEILDKDSFIIDSEDYIEYQGINYNYADIHIVKRTIMIKPDDSRKQELKKVFDYEELLLPNDYYVIMASYYGTTLLSGHRLEVYSSNSLDGTKAQSVIANIDSWKVFDANDNDVSEYYNVLYTYDMIRDHFVLHYGGYSTTRFEQFSKEYNVRENSYNIILTISTRTINIVIKDIEVDYYLGIFSDGVNVVYNGPSTLDYDSENDIYIGENGANEGLIGANDGSYIPDHIEIITNEGKINYLCSQCGTAKNNRLDKAYYVIKDKNGNDVTSNYKLVFSGTLLVNPTITITVNGINNVSVYDSYHGIYIPFGDYLTTRGLDYYFEVNTLIITNAETGREIKASNLLRDYGTVLVN